MRRQMWSLSAGGLFGWGTGHNRVGCWLITQMSFYYKQRQLTCNLMMMRTDSGRKCVDVKACVKMHDDIIQADLPAHVLSGCDTVSELWGIGKGTETNVLKSGKKHLTTLGITTQNDDCIYSNQLAFIAQCYDHQNESNVRVLHCLVWITKMVNLRLTSFRLARLVWIESSSHKWRISKLPYGEVHYNQIDLQSVLYSMFDGEFHRQHSRAVLSIWWQQKPSGSQMDFSRPGRYGAKRTRRWQMIAY